MFIIDHKHACTCSHIHITVEIHKHYPYITEKITQSKQAIATTCNTGCDYRNLIFSGLDRILKLSPICRFFLFFPFHFPNFLSFLFFLKFPSVFDITFPHVLSTLRTVPKKEARVLQIPTYLRLHRHDEVEEHGVINWDL